MAKAPVAGKVKTRLAKKCGLQKAAHIAYQMIDMSIRLCIQGFPIKPVLCVDDVYDKSIQDLAKDYSLEVVGQSNGDLGVRIYTALSNGLRDAQFAAVMGCDVPHCGVENLRNAAGEMIDGNNVIGPCTDGGFYFLGVREVHVDMFANVSWSTEKALRQTIDSCKNVGIGFDCYLQQLSDIDYWEDFQDVCHNYPALKRQFNM